MWVARDNDMHLYLFRERPEKIGSTWHGDSICELPQDMYDGLDTDVALQVMLQEIQPFCDLWVARDLDKSLTLFQKEPTRKRSIWAAHVKGWSHALPQDLFPSVHWLTGPRKVKLILEE